jgi:hypothetical protein
VQFNIQWAILLESGHLVSYMQPAGHPTSIQFGLLAEHFHQRLAPFFSSFPQNQHALYNMGRFMAPTVYAG